LHIIVLGIEPADQAIQTQRRFMDFRQQSAPDTAAFDPSAAIDRRIVPLVAGATAREAARTDSQQTFIMAARVSDRWIAAPSECQNSGFMAFLVPLSLLLQWELQGGQSRDTTLVFAVLVSIGALVAFLRSWRKR
jgi:hypothetical protein